MTWAKHRNRISPYSLNSPLLYFQCKEIHLNGVQTKFKCKLNVKRCKRFVFPPSSLLHHFNALKTKAINYFQTVRTLTRIVSPPLCASNYRLRKTRWRCFCRYSWSRIAPGRQRAAIYRRRYSRTRRFAGFIFR
nr:MAG TPA: hypothetical protein [Caudoviricetes sp.]